MLYVGSLRAFSKASFLSLLILLSFACDDSLDPPAGAANSDASNSADRPSRDFPDNLEDPANIAGGAENADLDAPILLATRPVAYDGLASEYSSFVAVFNEPINPASVTEDSFIVSKPIDRFDRNDCEWEFNGERRVPGAVNVNRGIVSFQPTEKFEKGRIYCVYFNAGITDLSGNPVDFAGSRVVGAVNPNNRSLLTYFFTSINDVTRSWDKGTKVKTKEIEHLELKVIADEFGRSKVFSISNNVEGERVLRYETSAAEQDLGDEPGTSNLIRKYRNNFFAEHLLLTYNSGDLSDGPEVLEDRTNLRNLHVVKDHQNSNWLIWQQDVGQVSGIFFRFSAPANGPLAEVPRLGAWMPIMTAAGEANESVNLKGAASYKENGAIIYYEKAGQIYSKVLLNDGTIEDEFLVSSYDDNEEWTAEDIKVSKNLYGVSMISWVAIRDDQKRLYYRYHKPSLGQMSMLGHFDFPEGDLQGHEAAIDGLTNAVFALKIRYRGDGGNSKRINFKLFYKRAGEIESLELPESLFERSTQSIRPDEEFPLFISPSGLSGNFLFAQNRKMRPEGRDIILGTLRYLKGSDLSLDEEYSIVSGRDLIENIASDYSGNTVIFYSKFHQAHDQAVFPPYSIFVQGGIKSLYAKVFSSRTNQRVAPSMRQRLGDEQLLEIDNASDFRGQIVTDFSWDGEGSAAWLQFDGVLPKIFINRFHNRALAADYEPIFYGGRNSIDAEGRYTDTLINDFLVTPYRLRPSITEEVEERPYTPLTALFESEKTVYLCDSRRNNASVFHLNRCENGIMGEDAEVAGNRLSTFTGGAWLDHDNVYMLQTNLSAQGVPERNYVYPATSHFFTGAASWTDSFEVEAPDNDFSRNVKPAMNRYGKIMIMYPETINNQIRLRAKTINRGSFNPYFDNMVFESAHEVSYELGRDFEEDVSYSMKNEARIFTDIEGSFHLFWVQGRFLLYRKYRALNTLDYSWGPITVVTEELAQEPIHDMTAQVNINGDMFVAYTTNGERELFYRYKSRNDVTWSEEQVFTPPQRTYVTEIVGDLQSAINDDGAITVTYTSFISELCRCIYENAKRQWALVGPLSQPTAMDLVSNYSDFYYNAFEMNNNHARSVVTKDKAHIFLVADLTSAENDNNLYHVQCSIRGDISCSRPVAVDGVDEPVEWPTVAADDYGNVFFAYRTRLTAGGTSTAPDSSAIGLQGEINAGDRQLHYRKYVAGSGYTPVGRISGNVGDFRIRLSVSRSGHADLLYVRTNGFYHQRLAFGLHKIENQRLLTGSRDNPLSLSYFYRDQATDMLLNFAIKSVNSDRDFKIRVYK